MRDVGFRWLIVAPIVGVDLWVGLVNATRVITIHKLTIDTHYHATIDSIGTDETLQCRSRSNCKDTDTSLVPTHDITM